MLPGASTRTLTYQVCQYCLKLKKRKWARELEQYSANSQFTYNTPALSGMLEGSKVVSPFRLFRNTESTLGSPQAESPMREMRKSYISNRTLGTPTARYAASMEASTLVGEDVTDSDAPVLRAPQRAPRKHLPHPSPQLDGRGGVWTPQYQAVPVLPERRGILEEGSRSNGILRTTRSQESNYQPAFDPSSAGSPRSAQSGSPVPTLLDI
ncbi:hypothetical protein H0H87_006309 [Tephrocybe sp. NHM501043]|nr:hypothetical protein H0H87_006309 [Tephrocybe sp. NHM501043]